MGTGLTMKKMDLIELYQLLSVYRRTYTDEDGQNITEILSNIEGHFRDQCGGKDIRDARNPREAGRKRKYTDAEDARIKELRASGMSIRGISRAVGCSAGHIQDVLNREKERPRPWMYLN